MILINQSGIAEISDFEFGILGNGKLELVYFMKENNFKIAQINFYKRVTTNSYMSPLDLTKLVTSDFLQKYETKIANQLEN